MTIQFGEAPKICGGQPGRLVPSRRHEAEFETGWGRTGLLQQTPRWRRIIDARRLSFLSYSAAGGLETLEIIRMVNYGRCDGRPKEWPDAEGEDGAKKTRTD